MTRGTALLIAVAVSGVLIVGASWERLIGEATPTTRHRLNVGGPVLPGSPSWSADAEVNSDRSATLSTDPSALSSPSHTADTPSQLFATGRKLAIGGEAVKYDFPVPPGDYEVRLFFAAADVNERAGENLLDASLEDELVLRDYDVYAETDRDQTAVERARITVSDDALSVAMAGRAGAPALTGLEVLPATPDTPGRRVFHIAPQSKGRADGSSWDNPGTLSDIPAFIDAAQPEDAIWLLADGSEYPLAEPMVLRSGGETGEPVTVRGVDRDGRAVGQPVLVGSRADPYDPDGETGEGAFRLEKGANNLVFDNLAFRNVGNGAFRLGGDIQDVVIDRVSAQNVRRLVENRATRKDDTATVSGLVVRRSEVRGFSKSVITLRGSSHDVLIEDVVGDSQRQDGDRFAMGIHLSDTVHDVLIRRTTMRNSHDSTKGQKKYWNGDGFVANSGVRGLTLIDTVATGSTDAGYDLKSADTLLVRPFAADNKRNYRFWNDGIEVENCVGENPHKRGGNGTQTQVQLAPDSAVVLRGCTFRDDSPDTVVFEVSEGSLMRVWDTRVRMHPAANKVLTRQDAESRLTGVTWVLEAR